MPACGCGVGSERSSSSNGQVQQHEQAHRRGHRAAADTEGCRDVEASHTRAPGAGVHPRNRSRRPCQHPPTCSTKHAAAPQRRRCMCMLRLRQAERKRLVLVVSPRCASSSGGRGAAAARYRRRVGRHGKRPSRRSPRAPPPRACGADAESAAPPCRSCSSRAPSAAREDRADAGSSRSCPKGARCSGGCERCSGGSGDAQTASRARKHAMAASAPVHLSARPRARAACTLCSEARPEPGE